MADEWETFLTEHGDDITSTVHDNMRREANLFDIEDGTHAGWCGDRLGILVVLTEEEAEGYLSASSGIRRFKISASNWGARSRRRATVVFGMPVNPSIWRSDMWEP